MSEARSVGDILGQEHGHRRSHAEALVANTADPLRLVSEAISKIYAQSVREGDEALRVLALTLNCDLTRRRREAGLPPIKGLWGVSR